MSNQEVVQRTPQQQLAQTIEGDYFREQIAKALPANVTVDRFQRALLTAVMQNPDVAKADHQSIVLAAIRCAQDGLLPDGRQAAIAVFGGKATYMPMIGGLRHALADYGWTLRTRVVRDGDQFEWSEEPPMIKHTPAPSGDGALVYAYAIATHKDGRRVQRVVFPHEIQKRQAVAKTQNVWKQWPAEMWAKTSGHMLFDEIPLGAPDEDRERIARIVAGWEENPDQAVDAIYGPAATAAQDPPMEPEAGAPEPAAPEGEQASSGEPIPAAAGSSPDPEPTLTAAAPVEEPPLRVPAVVVDQSAQTMIASQEKTVEQVMALAGADDWLRWALSPSSTLDPDEQAAVELVVRERRPDLWEQTSEQAA